MSASHFFDIHEESWHNTFPTCGADSSAWQIRDFSARRCIRVSFVCCSCLSGSCLLRWLSNPQALITQSCLSHWYESACRQSQVWTSPKEVDATARCSYCSDFTGGKNLSTPLGWNSLDFLVVMLNSCFFLLAHSKRLPPFNYILSFSCFTC